MSANFQPKRFIIDDRMTVRKQHIVPQCYLRNFTSNNQIFVLDKEAKKIYSASINDIAQKRFFYDFPDGFLPKEFQKGNPQFIENALSKRERSFCQCLRQIIDYLEKVENDNVSSYIPILTQEAKRTFSRYLTIQLIRTNSMRKGIRNMLQGLSDFKEKLDNLLVKNKDSSEIKFPHFTPSPNSINFNDLIRISLDEDTQLQHLYSVSKSLSSGGSESEIYKILTNHIWLFCINPTSIPLWTSDNPIVIQPYEQKGIEGIGLSSDGVQVIYPISHKHLLIMFEPDFWLRLKNLDSNSTKLLDRMSATLSEDDVKSYNRLQAQQCYRQTYSSKNDFEILSF